MRLIAQLRSFIIGLLWRKRIESSMNDEIRFHIEAYTRDLVQSGVQEDEAERRARIEFGGIDVCKERCREARGFRMLEQFAQDIRYCLRSMASNPGFATVAVLLLALGIGANTAIYSFMDAIMMRALPVQHPEQLAILNWHAKDLPAVSHHFSGNGYRDTRTGFTSGNFPFAVFELVRARNDVFSNVFAFASIGRLIVETQGRAEIAVVS